MLSKFGDEINLNLKTHKFIQLLIFIDIVTRKIFLHLLRNDLPLVLADSPSFSRLMLCFIANPAVFLQIQQFSCRKYSHFR